MLADNKMSETKSESKTSPAEPAGGSAVQVARRATVNIYQEITNMLGEEKITSSNIASIMLSLMQIAEKYEHLNGTQKKSIVLNVLDRLVQEQIPEHQTKSAVKLLIQTTFPAIVDTLISMDKGQFAIKLKKVTKGCLPCFR